MPLYVHFSPDTDWTGECKDPEDPTSRYGRLRKEERLCLTPEMFRWNLPMALMGLDLMAITPTTLPVFIDRAEILWKGEFYTVCHWACQFIDHRDPEEVRERANTYRDQPFENLDLAKSLMTHWIGDRFSGLRVNVSHEPNLRWVEKLKLSPTCTGDDLQAVSSNGYGWSPTELLGQLEEAATGEERNRLYNRLYHLLSNCIFLGSPEEMQQTEEDDDEDLLYDEPVSFRQHVDKVQEEIEQIFPREHKVELS